MLIGLALAVVPDVARSTGEPPRSSAALTRVDGWRDVGAWSLSEPVPVDDVVLVGVDDPQGDLAVRARDGREWGEWLPLVHVDGHGHGHGSEPVWTGPADALQVRRRSGTGPVELTTVTVSGGDGLAFAPGAAPGAALADGHPVVPRTQWDPRGECRPRRAPAYGVARLAYVHHTVMFPRYSPEQADDVVRAVCLFHVETRGFDDIGYNFLVDRYGTAYEGRAGGLDLPVAGAHAAGFNEASFGVTVVGDFERDTVPPAALESVARLIADRFHRYNIDPRSAVEVVSTDEGTLSRYRVGKAVRLPTIVGHRDTATNTLCPGGHLYARLGSIRQRVADLLATELPAAPAPPRRVIGRPASALPELALPAADSSAVTGIVDEIAAPAVLPDLPVTGAGTAAAGVLVVAAVAVGRGRRRGP